jgi:hypothetical protein
MTARRPTSRRLRWDWENVLDSLVSARCQPHIATLWHWVALNVPVTVSPFFMFTLYEPLAVDADGLKLVSVSVPPIAETQLVDVVSVHTEAVEGALEPPWTTTSPGPFGSAVPQT